MKNLEAYTEGFKLKLDRFITGCDAIEDSGLWDRDTHGEMDSYYQNDMISVIVQLISVDGNFSVDEVRFVNEAFGFDYSVNELRDVYFNCKDAIDIVIDSNVVLGMSYLRSINEMLADAYKDLLLTICDIIMNSDGKIKKVEVQMINTLKKALL